MELQDSLSGQRFKVMALKLGAETMVYFSMSATSALETGYSMEGVGVALTSGLLSFPVLTCNLHFIDKIGRINRGPVL